MDTVIFDYGEVLSHTPPAGFFERAGEICRIAPEQLEQLYWEFRSDYDRGVLDGVAYWSAIAHKAARTFSEARTQELIREDIASWSSINDAVVAWALQLKRAGWKIGVLSNMHVDLAPILRSRTPWLLEFDHLTFSCEVGCVKPDREIYEQCLAGLNARAQDALFLDDRPVNVEAAERYGIRAICFRSLAQAAAEIQARKLPVPLP